MREQRSSLNQRIAARVQELRRAQGRSLDGLAQKTGVSRSMISVIERGKSSPTAVVLEKLASGLGVTLAALFEEAAPVAAKSTLPLARRSDQSQWRDPGSGYIRRNVSPTRSPQPMQIVEVHFPAGARVAFESGARDVRIYQQIWILAGVMEVRVGDERHRLREGDCLAMEIDRPTLFHNPTRKAARYAVVLVSEAFSRR